MTLISRDLSEFALHVRAFLGLPVGAIRQYGPAASAVILPQLTSQNVTFSNLQGAVGAGLQLRLFGKPEIDGSRRLGVTLAVADSVDEAVARAKAARQRCRFRDKKPGRVNATGSGFRHLSGRENYFAPSTASRAILVIRS